MATNSKIEWTEQTWNPLTGCTKISPDCKYCYAEMMSKRLSAMKVKRYEEGFSTISSAGIVGSILMCGKRCPSGLPLLTRGRHIIYTFQIIT